MCSVYVAWGWEDGTYIPHARGHDEVHGYAAVLEKPLAVGHRAHELRDELLAVDVGGYRHDELELVVLCVMVSCGCGR